MPAEFKERCVDVGISLEANAERPEMMQPSVCVLNDPTDLSKTAAVRFPASGDSGNDAEFVQDAPVLVVIVTTIRVDALGVAQWSTANSLDRQDGVWSLVVHDRWDSGQFFRPPSNSTTAILATSCFVASADR